MPNNIYDVIVVGAGPAGLAVSLECAQASLNLLLIEESPLLSTEKSWLTFNDALTDYPLLEKAITNTVNRLKFFNGVDDYFDSGPTPIQGYIIEQTLMNKAYKEALAKYPNAIILERTIYQKSERWGGKVKVKTNRGEFNAKVVVDASGSYSVVAGDLKLANENFWLLMCCFIRVAKKNALEDYGCAAFSYGGKQSHLLGTTNALYPNSFDYFDVGVGDYLRNEQNQESPKDQLRNKMANVWNFYQQRGLIKKDFPFNFRTDFYGGIRLTRRQHIYADNLLVVGDAAGQGSPITGEGLRTGLYYGKMAGQVIAKAVRSNNFSRHGLKEYAKLCQKFPLFDYQYGLIIQKIARKNILPKYFFTWIQNRYNKNKDFWRDVYLKILKNAPLPFGWKLKILLKFLFV